MAVSRRCDDPLDPRPYVAFMKLLYVDEIKLAAISKRAMRVWVTHLVVGNNLPLPLSLTAHLGLLGGGARGGTALDQREQGRWQMSVVSGGGGWRELRVVEMGDHSNWDLATGQPQIHATRLRDRQSQKQKGHKALKATTTLQHYACIHHTDATPQTPPAQPARSPHLGHAPKTQESVCRHRPVTVRPTKLRIRHVSPKKKKKKVSSRRVLDLRLAGSRWARW